MLKTTTTLAIIAMMLMVALVRADLAPTEGKSQLTGMYRGTFKQNGVTNEAALALSNDFAIMDTKGLQFTGLVLTQKADANGEGKLVINGRSFQSCGNETVTCFKTNICDCSKNQLSHFENVNEKCIYKYTSTESKRTLKIACAEKTVLLVKKKEYPTSFTDSDITIEMDMTINKDASGVPENYRGGFLGKSTEIKKRLSGDVQSTEDTLVYVGEENMLILTKEMGEELYTSIHCKANFQTGGSNLDCTNVIEGGLAKSYNMTMRYNFDATKEELKVAYDKEGGARPSDFNVQGTVGVFAATRVKNSDISYSEQADWYGRVKDQITGLMLPQVCDINENRISFRSKYRIMEGVYTTESEGTGKGKITIMGVGASRSNVLSFFSNFKLHVMKGRYETSTSGSTRFMTLAFNRFNASAGVSGSINFADDNLEILTFSTNAKASNDKPALTLQSMMPRSGKAGARIRIQTGFRDAAAEEGFRDCPNNLKVFLGDSECTGAQCDTKNGILACKAGDSSESGPKRISFEIDGQRQMTDEFFGFIKGSVKVPRISRCIPRNGAVEGGEEIFIPVSDMGDLTSKTVSASIDGRECKATAVVEKYLVKCTTPSFSSPGEKIVVVKVDGVSSVAGVKFNVANKDALLRLSPPRPDSGKASVENTVKFVVFVKNGDGKVPSDLATTVMFGNQPAAYVSNVTATSNPKIYQVTAKTPKFTQSGRVKVTVTAVTQGTAYVGTSFYTATADKVEDDVRILDVSPKSLTTAGGELTIKAYVPRAYVAVDVENNAAASAIYIGDQQCEVTSEPVIECVEGKENTQPCIATVKCTAPASFAGSAYVSVAFPGGSSVGNVWFTYTSTDSPTITGTNPTTAGISVNTTFTISGSKFIKASRAALDACANVNVALGDATCETTACSATSLTASCVAPVVSGGASVVVSTSGQSSSSDPTVSDKSQVAVTSGNQPSITNVSPNSATVMGGSELTITGTNFGTTQGDVQVEINGSPCKDVKLESTTQIKCTTAGGVEGKASMQVTVASESSSFFTGFSYTGSVTCTDCKQQEFKNDDNNNSAAGTLTASSFSLAIICLFAVFFF